MMFMVSLITVRLSIKKPYQNQKLRKIAKSKNLVRPENLDFFVIPEICASDLVFLPLQLDQYLSN